MARIKWSGEEWEIAPESYKHPAEYGWKQDIKVDENGHLPLDLVKVNGKCLASMIYSVKPIGYGTTQVLIKGLHKLDKNTVFGLFAYAWQNQHEQDMLEQAKWRSETNKAFQITTQKPAEGGSMVHDVFDLDLPIESDVLVTMYWTPEHADFMVEVPGKVLRKWRSTTPVNALLPVPTRMFINLYPCTDFKVEPNIGYPPEVDEHVVVKAFSYTPIGAAVPSLWIETPPVVDPVEDPPVVTPPAVEPSEPFVPVTTILPDVEIRRDIISNVISAGTVYYKKNNEEWKASPGVPIEGEKGDTYTFVAIDSKGNVGPFRTVKL